MGGCPVKERIARHIAAGGAVVIRPFPGGESYPPCIAVDLLTGQGCFYRYHINTLEELL
jgi:hypothetical protein